ncbi:MAG: hypothetical protein ACAH09_02170 [Methylophilaceae bacterium]|jgi:hypothetical protein
MRKTRLTLVLLGCLFASGCAYDMVAMEAPNIEQNVTNGPFIKKLTETTYPSRTPEKNIQVFYKIWDAFTSSNIAIENWEYHFKMGAGSNPTQKYLKISEINHYQIDRDDNRALSTLQNIASKEGGDAIFDVWRTPAIKKASSVSKIIGYRYRAIVIRYEPI